MRDRSDDPLLYERMLYLGTSSRYQKIFMNLFKTVYYSVALDIFPCIV